MESPDHLEQAKQIAITAATLDSDKNGFPEEVRDIAALCVDQLHFLAEKLAGTQVTKVYL